MRSPHLQKRRFGLLSVVCTVLLALFAFTSNAQDTSSAVAFDLVGSSSQNLTSFSNGAPSDIGVGDCFGITDRSQDAPFGVLDDSLSIFTGDNQGIIKEANTDSFMCVTDADAIYSATWEFDISGATDLTLNIDMGAMGDFESDGDFFTWTYIVDGSDPVTAFTTTVDEAIDNTYTLEGGGSFVLDDPILVDGTIVDNDLTTFSFPIAETGSNFALTLTASNNAGTEAYAFQNIIISSPNVVPPANIIITEVMQNPDAVGDNAGEYFEVYNAGSTAVDLNGWTISDNGTNSHVIASSVVVNAGAYAVLATNGDSATNGGFTADYVYSNIALANGDDELVLTDTNANEIDRIEWDGGPIWPDPTGASMSLCDLAADNNDGTQWLESTVPYGDGDLGTPGTVNDCIAPSAPQIVITEIMQNPAAVGDNSGEYFEVYNAGNAPVDLNGWTISDNGADNHVIASSVVINVGEYAVLANNGDTATNGGLTVDYVYSGVFLANGDDEVVLTDADSNEIDRVEYDGGPIWPDPTGASMSLVDLTADNNDGTNWCTATTAYGDGDLGTPSAANDCDDDPPPTGTVFIHEIQGSGDTVAITTPVTVEAIVTGDFQGDASDGQLGGFFIQEEDVDADTDSATSEGIQVFCGFDCLDTFPDVAVGDLVQVTGTPSEFEGMSQIGFVSNITVVSSGNPLPTAISITLPIAAPDVDAFYETLEGMLVSYTNPLVVSEYFQLARFGQVVLYGDERPYQFTDNNTPDIAGFAAHQDALERNRVILDDDDNLQNSPLPDGIIYHPQPNGFGVGTQGTDFFRGGDTVSSLTGILQFADPGSGPQTWRIRPVAEAFPVTFTPVNTRSATPDAVGGNVTVASLNVLNYFTSIDGGDCSANPANQCRGADSVSELERQTLQTVTALAALDADVVGLVEIENNGTAVGTLVAELNAVVGASTYAYIDTGIIGTDAITVAIIYKPAVLAPIGTTSVLDDAAFTDPLNYGTQRNRPAVAQSFEVIDTANPDVGAVFTTVVNHLKSKNDGGCTGADCDLDNGAAGFNATRTMAALYMVNTWLPSDPTGVADSDILILGDLNAYAAESPITTIESAGYTDLIESFSGGDGYSFVFDGQIGYLDYAMSSSSMTPQVTGVTEWHVNADEVNVFDYNDTIQDPAEASFEAEPSGNELFAGDGFRNSDHDPVLVGLDLEAPANQAPIVNAGDDVIVDEGAIVNFVGMFEDDSASQTVEWSFGATTLNASTSFDDGPATVEVTLTVTDEEGLSGSDSVMVTVNNVAPTATFTSIFADPTFQGQYNTFVFNDANDPSQADTDAGFVYAVDCTDDGVDNFTILTGTDFNCQMTVAGNIEVRGSITDKDGGTTVYSVIVEVLSPSGAYDYIAEQIHDLVDSGSLSHFRANVLLRILERSELFYNYGYTNVALNQLNSLLNYINLYQRFGILSQAEADSLRYAVENLFDSIVAGY